MRPLSTICSLPGAVLLALDHRGRELHSTLFDLSLKRRPSSRLPSSRLPSFQLDHTVNGGGLRSARRRRCHRRSVRAARRAGGCSGSSSSSGWDSIAGVRSPRQGSPRSPFPSLLPPARHVLCCHGDGRVCAQLPADAAQAGGAGVRLPGALPGRGSRDEPGVGDRRRPVLPVPVGVLLEAGEHGELAVQQHAGLRLAGCYAGPVARGRGPGADVLPGRSGRRVHRYEAAVLRSRRPHALRCSCPAGLQLGPLPHQVHREHQPEDLPRVQLGLRPGLGRHHLLLRRGDPLLPQPQELRGVLLAGIQAAARRGGERAHGGRGRDGVFARRSVPQK